MSETLPHPETYGQTKIIVADLAAEPFRCGRITQRGWLHSFLAAETDLQTLSYRPSDWDQHQDVIVCTRRAPSRQSLA